MINRDYRKLKTLVEPFTSGKGEVGLLQKAYTLSCRNSVIPITNEPASTYLTNLCQLVIKEFNLGLTSVISTLLCKIDSNNEAFLKFLQTNNLNDSISIIDSYQQISKLPVERVVSNADNFAGIILALAHDMRSLLISLAEVLYQLRNHFSILDKAELMNLLNRTEHIYIPLSHKLGLYRIVSEMEELIFKIHEPEKFSRLAIEIEKEVSKSRDFIQMFIEPIKKEFQRMELDFTIKSRTKSVNSVHNKMVKQNIPFDEIFDLFAIRVIINSSDPESEKSDCWKAYSVITNLYEPATERMRDWITIPRPNGYESLHITVRDKSNRWVEVQIRTKRMDTDAEFGNAAHWRYKGGKGNIDTVNWLNSVREILENPNYTEESLISKNSQERKEDSTIYVFTPNGDLIKLKKGSTVLDFAFELHTVVGSKCTGGRVNQKIVPIRQILKNGDTVEIITSKNQTPNRDWLNWVATSRAKSKIKRYLKEAEFKFAEVGKDILRRKLSQLKLPFNDEQVNKLISHFKFKNALELYQQLADNKIDPSQIKDVLLGRTKDIPETSITKEPVVKQNTKTAEDTILVNEESEFQGFTLARCCNPVMGDEIFGFVMTAGGIKIHRITCPNAPRLKTRYPYRVMKAKWHKVSEGSYFSSSIQVSGIDQLGILNTITEMLSKELKVNVRNISFNSNKGHFEGFVKVSVKDSRHIDSLMKKLEGIKGVTRVKRIN